ncbi:hypothetical protein Psyaliredsea_32080 [Psychrobacter alimentarius]
MIVAIPLLSLGFLPFLLITILSCFIGIWICGRTSELMKGHDDPHIVWDEWAGMWLTLLPFSYMSVTADNFWHYISQPSSLAALLLAFVLFRFFDIIKPPPIGWADRKVAGGLGVMLDDIIAGVMALIVWIIVMIVFSL